MTGGQAIHSNARPQGNPTIEIDLCLSRQRRGAIPRWVKLRFLSEWRYCVCVTIPVCVVAVGCGARDSLEQSSSSVASSQSDSTTESAASHTSAQNAGPVAEVDVPWRTLAATAWHACAINADRTVACWGSNTHGQLGETSIGSTGHPLASANPRPVTVEGLEAVEVGAGCYHSCALTKDGEVRCWGGNVDGQLGIDDRSMSVAPIAVPGLRATRLSVGCRHSCAITRGGRVACWGANYAGQLGAAHLERSSAPLVVDVDGAIDVATGHAHSCSIDAAGSVRCWGLDRPGEVAKGAVRVLSVGDVAQVSAGSLFGCLLRRDSAVACWGTNGLGQLGRSDSADEGDPSLCEIPGLRAVRVASGNTHSCAIAFDGSVSCWGRSHFGEAGSPIGDHAAPTTINGLFHVTELAIGVYFSCARRADGSIACWGDNSNGVLGNSTETESLEPVSVKLP